MTANPAERLDLEVIQDLDFGFDPPCEHPHHDESPHHSGPAWALVELMPFPCGCMGDGGRIYMCKPSLDDTAMHRCRWCGDMWEPSVTHRIIALVRP